MLLLVKIGLYYGDVLSLRVIDKVMIDFLSLHITLNFFAGASTHRLFRGR